MGRDALIQLKCIIEDEPIEYPECIDFLRQALRNNGYTATCRQVQRAWLKVSASYCAGWLLADTYKEDEAFSMIFPYMKEKS